MVNSEQIGYMDVQDSLDKDILQVPYLYTQEHKSRKYKGAGTQLLKCAVEESIKRGYNGKLKLQASHSACSPMVFYYKNNFVIPRPSDCRLYGYENCHNAVIEYAIANNIPIDNLLPETKRSAFMKLDEQGAKAFLQGKQLYKERSVEKLAEKNIDDENYSANLIKSPNSGEYFLLIVNENSGNLKADLVITLQEKTDENNVKHLKICDICEYEFSDNEDMNFAFETVEKLAQEKGYDKTTVTSDLNRRAKRLYRNSDYKFDEEN